MNCVTIISLSCNINYYYVSFINDNCAPIANMKITRTIFFITYENIYCVNNFYNIDDMQKKKIAFTRVLL